MSILAISYDLVTPDKDYSAFYEAIKGNAESWWHYLTNVWLVKTNLTETQYSRILYPHMTQSDRLLIVQVMGSGDGWLPKEAWIWIAQQTGAQVDPHALSELFDVMAKQFPQPPK